MDTDKPLLSDTSLDQHTFEAQVEPRRWWILIAFSLYNASTALAWLTYGSVGGTSMQYFNIDVDELLLFSDSILYMYFFFSYIGCWFIFNMFKKSLLFCAFLTAVGGWIRYFAGTNYIPALIGQFTIGLCYAPAFGFATLIPDRWFSVKERFFVTMISVYSSYFGWALGYILPCIIVGDDVKKMPTNLAIQATIMTVPIIIGFFCVKDKPDKPPSYSAYVKLNDHRTFLSEIITLAKSPKFVASSVIFGLVLGISYSVSTVSAIFMDPLGLSYTEQGIIGFCYVFSGMVSGFVGTLWLEKQQTIDYDYPIRVLLSTSLGFLTILGVIFLYASQPSMLVILICNCLLGMGLIGLTPFICSSIIESTFPIQEPISTNAMFMFTQLFSIITGHIATSEAVGKKGFLLLALFILPCWIYGMFFYKTDYKKQVADSQHKVLDRELVEIEARSN